MPHTKPMPGSQQLKAGVGLSKPGMPGRAGKGIDDGTPNARNEQDAITMALNSLSDEDLQRAKSAFFEIDTDSTGFIEREELALALKTLGHAPTEEQMAEMMGGADGNAGDSSGRVDLREFLRWYARTVKGDRDGTDDDVLDAFRALGGTAEQGMEKAQLRELLRTEYDLDIDVDEIFAGNGSATLDLAEFKRMMTSRDR
uniref:EF-hand domain-containing protein n=1 Tax=Chrysotila carterae TaxID=13221 RepID=A0A7S4BKE8_CHRCT|mmetsp:Transcript_57786/g.125460  ORF Transcript_57786/g.125460 Transcript_57786/m.125460 type:complete len:200 (-) Transcript_57786:680-1279(-)